jgi:carbonic anhydrase
VTDAARRCQELNLPQNPPYKLAVADTLRSLYTPSDDSLNAVLMIALINFQVKHIIVCVRNITLVLYLHLQGHSNCVGCQTALRSAALPPVAETQAIQRYLRPLTSLARALKTEDGLPSLDLLIEENVIQQVKNLVESPIVQDDWKRRGKKGVTIHGWVYQLENVSMHGGVGVAVGIGDVGRQSSLNAGYRSLPQLLEGPARIRPRRQDGREALHAGRAPLGPRDTVEVVGESASANRPVDYSITA